MKISLISAVFPPEPVVSAKTSFNLACELACANHQVWVITNFPNRPGGEIYAGYRRTLYSRGEHPGGFHVLRCFSTFSKQSTLFSRWMENITFGLTSSIALLFSPRPDVVYANTWPIFAMFLTSLACKIRKIPLVLSIQDVYPESLVTQGRLKPDQLIYQILRWMDRLNARMARALIVISEGFARIYYEDRGIPTEKVYVIPNWIDPEEIQLLPKNRFRQKVGIPENAFVFGYAGNIGAAAGVENLIRAFAKIGDPNVYLLIAGDGSRRQTCSELVEQLQLKNVIVYSPWPKEETSEVLAAADVLVLPTQGEQSLASVPSKMLSYMLAARPILAVVAPNSDIAQIIQDASCGWQINPMDQRSLVNAMSIIRNTNLEQLCQLGKAGYEYANAHFSKENSLNRVIKVLTRVVGYA